ncbi:MAG: hypothetical protein KDC38_19640, partial [Planctomycetes bacterium]|nr:hypothetical protein [Planctomycetota bacterium]
MRLALIWAGALALASLPSLGSTVSAQTSFPSVLLSTGDVLAGGEVIGAIRWIFENDSGDRALVGTIAGADFVAINGNVVATEGATFGSITVEGLQTNPPGFGS